MPVPHAVSHADAYSHADAHADARTAVPLPLPDAHAVTEAGAASAADSPSAPDRAETTGHEARTPPGAACPRTSDHEAARARARTAASSASAEPEPDASAHRATPASGARPRGAAPLPARLASPAEERHLRRHRDPHDHRARGARDGDPAPAVQVTRRPDDLSAPLNPTRGIHV